jgi:NitT/TauT family transport system substrate-binding protein
MRWALSGLMVVLTACGGLGGPAATPTPGAPVHVKVAWVSKAANMAPAWLALDGGYFKEQGLDAELTYINSSTTGMAAMVAGEVDILQAAGSAVVTASAATSAQDSSKKPVMFIGTVVHSVFKLMVQKGVTGTDQLKGKTLCITKPATADDIALRVYLKKQSLDPAKDVVILSGGSTEGCVAMLEANRAIGGVFSTPNTAILQQRGFSVLADFAKLGIDLLQLGVSVLRSYLDAHADVVEKFTRAYIQAIHRFKVDKVFAKKMIAKYLEITDQGQIDDAYDTYKEVFERVPVPTDAALQPIIDTTAQAKGTLPSAYYDPTIVRKLDQNGFIRQVYGS